MKSNGTARCVLRALTAAAAIASLGLVRLPSASAHDEPWRSSAVRLDSVEQAKITQAKTDLATLKTALNTYEIDAGAFPTTDQGLKALVETPKDVKDWHGPYLKKLPKDPWGNDYVYRSPSKNDKTKDFDLLSSGPDGKEGGGDDVE